MKTQLSTGEWIDVPDEVHGSCVRCGEPMARLGDSPWFHTHALISNRYRHWMGSAYDHDATDNPKHPKKWRTPDGF